MPITTRSRIYVRWSTNPEAFNRTFIMSSKPDYYGTPRQVHEYIRSLKNKIGAGTYVRIDLTDKNGQNVSPSEVANILSSVYDRSY